MISPVKIWRNQKKIASLIGKTGTIVSWTIIRMPPTGFISQAPYPVVIVEFADDKPFGSAQGRRMTAQLVDWEENNLKKGQKVVTVIRRITESSDSGVIPYGIKVKPL